MNFPSTLLPLALLLAIPHSASALDVMTRSNSTTGFFDESSGMRTFEFSSSDFSSTALITDVNVSVTFAKSDNNSFVAEDEPLGTGTPFLDEIQLALTSPSGTTVTLIDFDAFEAGSAGFRGTITFDQSAALAVDSDPTQLMGGTFRPVGNASGGLERFHGESAVGEWSLSVADSVGGDGLSFYAASLQVASVPEPATLWLIIAMGPLALFTRYRSRRQLAAQAGPR